MDTLLGIVIGGVITFLTSRWYYHRASEELRQEAKELRHYLGITLRVLQALSDNRPSFVINWDELNPRPLYNNYAVVVQIFWRSLHHIAHATSRH